MWAQLATVLAFGTIVGVIFVAGCLVGAWIQRDVAFVVKVKEKKEKRKANPVGPSTIIEMPVKGEEHPSGPPKFPPGAKRQNPMDWRKDLKTGMPDLSEMVKRD